MHTAPLSHQYLNDNEEGVKQIRLFGPSKYFIPADVYSSVNEPSPNKSFVLQHKSLPANQCNRLLNENL